MIHLLTDIRRRAFCWFVLAGPLAALGCGPAAAEPSLKAPPVERAVATAEKTEKADKNAKPALGDKWVRVLTDAKGKPQAMQTAIVRYVQADKIKPGKRPNQYKQYVDLIGAIHIADKAYYEELNNRFTKYDAVLYELVAPDGTYVPKGRGTSNSNPLGALQNGMKNMLNVEHQLEQIDYTKENMIHADMSPTEFMESMDKKNEGFAQMYFKMLGAAMAAQSEQTDASSPDVALLTAMFSKDRPRQLKIALAKQFEGMETLLEGFSGPDGSTLITERNKRALDVLETELDKGTAKMAIFYGAGHLATMHKQIGERFDMKPVSVEWLEAWNLRK
jgi:hypothetical protein